METTNPIELGTRLHRNPELVAVDMDGDTVMMDVESGHYFGLDAVGSLVWHSLEQPASIQSIAVRVREEFEASEDDDVEGDMLAFFGELLADGLVVIARP